MNKIIEIYKRLHGLGGKRTHQYYRLHRTGTGPFARNTDQEVKMFAENLTDQSLPELECTRDEVISDPIYQDPNAQFHKRYVAFLATVHQEISSRQEAAEQQQTSEGQPANVAEARRGELTAQLDTLLVSEPYLNPEHVNYRETFAQVTNLSQQLASLNGGDVA